MTLFDAIQARPEHILQCPFAALLDGERVTVTWVGDRTAVYGPPHEKALARHARFEVDESQLRWAKRDMRQKNSWQRGRLMQQLSAPKPCAGITWCGTTGGYRRGCRKAACSAAKAEANSQYRRERIG